MDTVNTPVPDRPEADDADFEHVLGEELDLLAKLRRDGTHSTAPTTYDRARRMDLAGLAFSGGGIRSATFNLGVIQALSRYGLLSKFDYLSMVSGGSYIGGWLSALLNHSAPAGEKPTSKVADEAFVDAFQAELTTHPGDGRPVGSEEKTVGFDPVETPAVRYLRRYSNYLSPRLGLSGDMMAAVSIFLRNFALIQLSLIGLVASVLLLAHWVAAGSIKVGTDIRWFAAAGASWGEPWSAMGELLVSGWPFAAGVLAQIFSACSAGWLSAEHRIHDPSFAHAGRNVVVFVLLPSLVAAWLLSVATAMHPGQAADDTMTAVFLLPLVGYVLTWGAGYAAFWLRRGMLSPDRELTERRRHHAALISAWFAGAVVGALWVAAVCYLRKFTSVAAVDFRHAAAFGPPLFLAGLSLAVTVHIGLARRSFGEEEREWFARLGGYVLLAVAMWTTVFMLILYATPFVYWLAGGGLAALATWAGGSGLGAWLARGPATGGAGSAPWKEAVTRIAPWLFTAGLVIIVAHLTHIALMKAFLEGGFVPPPDTDFGIAATSALAQLKGIAAIDALKAFGIVAGLCALFVWRLDINLFSLHTFYANRLSRAYLGARRAKARTPNPFTGFDPADDLPFSDLAKQRPIPIVNTAINMTGGDDLAWQTRRAASFAFTPCWAGYETQSSQGVTLGRYRPTKNYAGGLSLGTLVAISGAAASPNMGYHTSAAVAALMTAFNLRLGRWCGNPDPKVDQDTWKKASPSFAANPIFAELTGSATAQAGWVNLTDGGHFENLGVYELIRRRCRLIVATDASCDPKHQFEDLANLLRKCWTDLGVNIRMEHLDPARLKENGRYCTAHLAIAHIEYHDDQPDGVLIYLKASMTGDEWPDIRQYADAHPDFPHQTTADQFFDENQFEAYRHLGYKVAAKMNEALTTLTGRPPRDLSPGELADALTHEESGTRWRTIIAQIILGRT